MGETTIAWCDYTFNPWRGCAKVSAGCANCYAEKLAGRNPRALGQWGPDAPRAIAAESYWRLPVKWNEKAAREGVRRRVFVGSLMDVFEDRPELVPHRTRLWNLMRKLDALDWLALTKRPQNWSKCGPLISAVWPQIPNLWVGVSIENQEMADMRIPILSFIPAAVRFLSCEPLLGPVDLGLSGEIDWVIVGGESGGNARPMHPEWVRSIRDQCLAAGVPFLFKQWGEWKCLIEPFRSFDHWVAKASSWLPGLGQVATVDAQGRICRIGADFMRARDENAFPVSIFSWAGKAKSRRTLDGRQWDEYPKVIR